MKTKIILILFVVLTSVLNAQKVNLKDGNVLLDGKAILKYEFRDYKNELHLFELNKNEESVSIQYHGNETVGYTDDDYLKIYFLDVDKKIETSNYSGNWKYTVSWLLENKILDSNGQFDEDKINLFIKKYDENITNRTIRTN